MTQVLLAPRVINTSGGASVMTDTTYQFKPNRDYVTDDGRAVKSVWSLPVSVDGAGLQVNLEPLPAGLAHQIRVTHSDGVGGFVMTTECRQIPAAPPSGQSYVILDELTLLDPDTLDPAAEPEAAWAVALGTAVSRVDEAVTAAAAAAPKTGFYLPEPSGGDDTAAVQAVINLAAQYGKTVIVGDRYRINGALTVASPLTIEGTGQGELYSGVSGTTAQTMVTITASDVAVRGLRLTGPQFAAAANQTVLRLAGASAASPLYRVAVTGCTITKSGKNGILAEHVRDFVISRNGVADCAYAGIGMSCVIGGQINDNEVRNITQTGYVNSYGIYTSRFEVDDLAVSPRSANVTICGNRVTDVPGWDGINTHGGQNHVIANNVITNCGKPIEVVGSDNGSFTKYAPLNVIVSGNTIDSGITDGSRSPGIVFVGAQGNGVIGGGSEMATGMIIGNTVKGHGKENTGISAAIVCYYTRGLVIAGNLMVEPSLSGLNLYHTNYDFVVTGNTVVDPWTNTASFCAAITVMSDYNTGYIGGGNRLVRGTKTATLVAQRGLHIANTANTRLEYGENDWSVATSAAVVDASQRIQKSGGQLRPGALADRPAASSAHHGTTYLATDVNGGTQYRCVNTSGSTYSWVQLGAGVTAAASATVDGLWRPRDNGMIGASGDPATCLIASQTAMVSGTQYVTKVVADQAGPVTSVMLYVAVAGTSITEASLDVYDSSGARIGTASLATALGSVGFKTVTLDAATSARAAGDVLWVGVRATFTGTAPQLRGLSTGAVPNANSGVGTKVRFGTAGTGVTAPLTSITPSAVSPSSAGAQCHWVGLI